MITLYILPEIDEIEIQRELKEEEELDARDLLVSMESEFEVSSDVLACQCNIVSYTHT